MSKSKSLVAVRLVVVYLVLFFSQVGLSDPKYLLYQKHKSDLNRLFQIDLKGGATEQALLSPILTISEVFQQKIDHENSDSEVFSQRYWINKSFAKGEDAPTLFYICGEGACGPGSLNTLSKQARDLGAAVVALEHRYYGESQPFSDFSTENLKFLTIQNALIDLVNFKSFAITNFSLGDRWILVGGSYAGSLAAFARSLYPDQFIGALASSAPVVADLNFDEYDEHVSAVAGPECVNAIQNVVQQIEKNIETEDGFAAEKKAFDAEILTDRVDFLYMIADIGAVSVQYGMKEQFCNFVITQGHQGYIRAAEMASGVFGNLANLSAKIAENTSLKAHTGAIGIRQWYYQSCTEFGFWQNASSDPNRSARSAQINPQYHQSLCKRLFNQDTDANVIETNQNFLMPILRKQNSNLLFTNGSDDPWMKLSLPDKSTETPFLFHKVMLGAAHCDDLKTNTNNPDVLEGQKLFLDLSHEWLDGNKSR